MRYKKKVSFQLMLVVSFASVGGWVVAADNVAISFTGTIQAAACSIDSGSNQTVVLGDISTTELGSPGDLSELKAFYFGLHCPVGGPGYASVTFTGKSASDPTLLALDDLPGKASGVAVRINEIDGKEQIKLNDASTTRVILPGQDALGFTAQYQALVDRPQIIAGLANATAQFTVNYP
ncbi:fimbrial protein [Lelliottia sp. V106_10]|uniref:fimbrial protein n=1 Tax=Lelliottia wanjuensis TaxID=3050585 RepID=UPI00254A2FC4|nr:MULTISPECIES: fimbrial protein [unclassified Lelliottia]MDK9358863.1 fimbrial protein [Lelliottia sp. V106_16]MDK9373550.1 fimbrial protein [Lelliottia sp. V106_10]MDK9600409.1 fimbrial protein [Lelliottia sp. V106_5]